MKRTLLFSLFLIVLAQFSWAEIPAKMSYQGVLTDANGVVVPDGNYSVRFRIYNVAGGGLPLWQETQSVAVASGRFNVILGSVATLDSLAFDQPYWLSMKVGSDPEMSPRIELVSSAYSLGTKSADCCSGVASDTQSGTVYFSGGYTTFASRSLTVPEPGYVLAIGSAQVYVEEVGTALLLGVSDDPYNFPSNQGLMYSVPDGLPDCSPSLPCHSAPITVHGLFEVTAGTHTFYFIGEPAAGGGSPYASKIQFSLAYFSQAYGTVEPTVIGGPVEQ
jgi:hypothetical protein